MAQDENLPDWLITLRDQKLAEQTPESAPPAPPPVRPASPPPMAEPPAAEPQPAVEEQPKDLLDSLREQVIQAGDEIYVEPKPFYKEILDLPPIQRLVLVILLFLNVALMGCMGLIMLGRIELPF